MIPLSLVNRNEVDDEEKVRVSPSKKKKCCSSCRSENKAGGGFVMSDLVAWMMKRDYRWIAEDDSSMPAGPEPTRPLGGWFPLLLLLLHYYSLLHAPHCL
mmetsp:Transcript_10686/g.21951  ORF Transcript_10686/g.21951 Transcript_10686/m.21951 type:complete len:100 (-) Transcript_10686:351-650(-)